MSTVTARMRIGHRPAAGLFGELDVDNFAGGGGVGMGFESAMGKAFDIAINHDPAAIEMHAINHPGRPRSRAGRAARSRPARTGRRGRPARSVIVRSGRT
jgi:site-specific DNA-cytosine methylase